jgi:hypothetical protein
MSLKETPPAHRDAVGIRSFIEGFTGDLAPGWATDLVSFAEDRRS